MIRKRILCITLLLSLLTPNIVHADDLGTAREKYKEYQTKMDSINTEIMKYSGDIQKKLSSIEENNKKIEDIDKEIAENDIIISGLNDKINKTVGIKDNRLREYYKNGGDFSYLELLFDSSSFMDFISKLDATMLLISVDKKLISDVNNTKKEVEQKLNQQESLKKDIEGLNKIITEDMKELESQKAEQESLLESVSSEQSKFDDEVLAFAEREVIKPQIDMINNSKDNLDNLKSAVNQLQSVKGNQIVSQTIKDEAQSKIDEARARINELIKSTYNIPNRSNQNANGQAIVDYAYQYVGTPYVWGGTQPGGFDCSGFTGYVYKSIAGMDISRTTYSQSNYGEPIGYNDLQPGDLVFTYGLEHVGIYVGDGMYINATYPGSTVRVTPILSFTTARRLIH